MSNSSTSSCLITLLYIVFGSIYFSVGVWEAVVASENSKNLTGIETEQYAFVVTKAILNIINGLSILFLGLIFICLTPDTDEQSTFNDKKNNSNIISLINLGVSIWGLIMYFNNTDSTINQFNQVIYGEMIIFFSGLAFILTLIIGTIIVVCTTKSPNNNQNINIKLNNSVISSINQPVKNVQSKVAIDSSLENV